MEKVNAQQLGDQWQAGEVITMLILDGQHAGHLAELVLNTWVCSCEGEARCHA